jgi:hypothetical protein
MRIDSSGSLLIGGTSSPATTKLLAKGATTGAEGITVQEVSGGGSTRFYVGFYNSSGIKTGDITTTGANTLYNSVSDARLKENIKDSSSSIEKLNSIKVRSFNLKNGNNVDFGVIAQELYEVASECVSKGDDKETIEQTWAVDTSVLIPAMIKAIQEQQALIENLTTRLNALEGK